MSNDEGLTISEKFVTKLCKHSFLKLWTHANPKGKNGKELCDCLVVFDNHIIIISVKDVEFQETGDEVGIKRWIRTAIGKSYSQLYGAVRWLNSVDEIERVDGRKISLPDRKSRIYHRISVSLGSKGRIPIEWGDFGKGFVHILDEISLGALFTILSTITDLVDFLMELESITKNGTAIHLMEGGLEHLVALYASNNNSFSFIDSNASKFIVDDDYWVNFINSDIVKKWQEDTKISYSWDRIIEKFSKDLLTDGLFNMHDKSVSRNELALIEMAKQPRNHRTYLAESFIEILSSSNNEIKSRIVKGYDDTAFVFLIGDSKDREIRAIELLQRCMISRVRMGNVKKVIGIAADKQGSNNKRFSEDIVFIEKANISEDEESEIISMQEKFGYFKNVKWSN